MSCSGRRRTGSATSRRFEPTDDLFRPRNHCVFKPIGALVPFDAIEANESSDAEAARDNEYRTESDAGSDSETMIADRDAVASDGIDENEDAGVSSGSDGAADFGCVTDFDCKGDRICQNRE